VVASWQARSQVALASCAVADEDIKLTSQIQVTYRLALRDVEAPAGGICDALEAYTTTYVQSMYAQYVP
jgi:hypothetical protein